MRTAKYAAVLAIALALVACKKKEVNVNSIVISPVCVAGLPGESFPLSWTISPADAVNRDEVKLAVKPASLATYENGMLTLNETGTGQAVVYCTSARAYCQIDCYAGSFSISGKKYYAEGVSGMLVYGEPGVASFVQITANSSDEHHVQITMNSSEFGKTYDLTKPIPEVGEYDSFMISSYLNNNEEFRSLVWYQGQTAVALNNLWEEQEATVTSGSVRVDQDPNDESDFKIALELTMSDGYSLQWDWDGKISARIDRYY